MLARERSGYRQLTMDYHDTFLGFLYYYASYSKFYYFEVTLVRTWLSIRLLQYYSMLLSVDQIDTMEHTPSITEDPS